MRVMEISALVPLVVKPIPSTDDARLFWVLKAVVSSIGNGDES